MRVFFFFWCGKKPVNTIPMLCRWSSFLANVYMVYALAFLLYLVCVNSSLCGWVNCFAVLDQIPMCPLKLLQICCERSCKQVRLCKLTGWFYSSQGARVLTAYPVLLLFSTIIFFSFLLGANASMTRVWGSASVFLPRVCGCRGRV